MFNAWVPSYKYCMLSFYNLQIVYIYSSRAILCNLVYNIMFLMCNIHGHKYGYIEAIRFYGLWNLKYAKKKKKKKAKLQQQQQKRPHINNIIIICLYII